MNAKLEQATRRYMELKTLFERERRQISLLAMNDVHDMRLRSLSKKLELARKRVEKLQNGSVK